MSWYYSPFWIPGWRQLPITYMYGLIAFKNNFVMNACNPNFTIQKDLCTGMYKLFQTIELSQIATCRVLFMMLYDVNEALLPVLTVSNVISVADPMVWGFGKGGGAVAGHHIPFNFLFYLSLPQNFTSIRIFLRVHHILYYIYWYFETSWNFINLLYNPQFLYVLLSF